VKRRGLLSGLVTWPMRVLAWGMDRAFGRRGLPALFFLLAVIVATAYWVRPPISSDIRSVHLSLGLLSPKEQGPEQLLRGPRRIPEDIPLDSAGGLALACIGGGLLLVLIAPRLLGFAAGVLLCAAVAGNAAIVNHPLLVEMMDQEFAQRRQIEDQIFVAPAQKHLTNSGNGRLSSLVYPCDGEQPGDLLRSWNYLLYGRWLVLWALLGILCGAAGSLQRRLLVTGAWLAVAVLLATGLCSRRLRAERHWLEAVDLESRNRPEEAGQALGRAKELFPEFAAMHRTWLLQGKLDYRLGKATKEERYFHLYQVARDRDVPRAVAWQEDLPWLIPNATDLRTGLKVPQNGSDVFAVPVDRPDRTGIVNFRVGPPPPPKDAYSGNYELDIHTQDLEIAAAIQDCLRGDAAANPTVKAAASRAWTQIGLRHNTETPHFNDSAGLDYWRLKRVLTSADVAYRRAAQLAPGGRDTAFYLASVEGFIQRDHPELAEAHLGPWLEGAGDRAVYADALAGLGASFFQAGKSTEARERYVKKAREAYANSVQMLSLPKVINTRALQGVGGP
jgi:hypothetical protein